MWFMFGFVTLISFSVYFGIKRYQARWQGDKSIFDDGPSYEYQFIYKPKSKTIKRMLVGVEAPQEFDFSFKRESGIDRFFKFLGISVEHQVGSSEFDKLVYVVSNDHHLFDQVMDDPKLLQSVTELFKLNHYDCRISHLHCRNGRLWVVFKVSSLFNDVSNLIRLSKIFPKVAESLQEIARNLRTNLPKSIGARRDPFILRAMLVLAISTGLLVNGATHMFRLVLFKGTFTVDTPQLWWYSVWVGAGLLGLLIGLAVYLLGRTARAHLVLIELVLVGSLGAVMTAFAEIRDINMDMDSSPAHLLETRILDKSISKSRRSGTRYYLKVMDWNGGQDTQRIEVSNDFYQGVQRGERVEITQRSGFLRLRWVESVAQAPKR